MPLRQNLIDIDTLFHQTPRKVILNTLRLTDDNLRELIYTTSGSQISMIPQCECGFYKRTYLLGQTCPRCNTSVIDTFDEIRPLLWVDKFDINIKFINPKFWADLANIINTNIDGLRWLSDTGYNPPKVPPIMFKLKDLIGGRSYTNLCNKLEDIIIYLKHNGQYKTMPKKIKLEALHRTYKLKKDILFTNTIPLINKKLFISEQSKDGSYNTMLLADIIDIAMMVVAVANDVTLSKKKIENTMGKLISSSARLYVMYVREMISRKGGLLRKNIYGTRAHFTFRGVLSGNTHTTDAYDHIRVPWIIALTAYRPHILNKLLKRGYVYKEASRLLFDSELQFNQVISEIIHELIDESPVAGLPVWANRNPTLGKASIELVLIVGFKEDVLDQTIDMKVTIMPGFNADLDGDALNFMLVLSNHLYKLAEPFRPIYNANVLGVYTVSSNLNLPKTTAITIGNYLNTIEEEEDNCEVYDMLCNPNLDIDIDLTKRLV